MPLDLFRDPNLAEVKLIEAPLRFFLARLQALLAEFPAHPILLQLVQLAQRLASLPVSGMAARSANAVKNHEHFFFHKSFVFH